MKKKKDTGKKPAKRKAAEPETVLGKDIGFRTDRVFLHPGMLKEKFFSEWPRKFELWKAGMDPSGQEKGSRSRYFNGIEDFIQHQSEIHARAVAYGYRDPESHDGECYGPASLRYALFILGKGDTAAFLEAVRKYDCIQRIRLDVREELAKRDGAQKKSFLSLLLQLLFGWAGNSAPLRPDNDRFGFVYHNVLGHVTVFPGYPFGKWHDSTEHRLKAPKKSWNGKLFSKSKTMKGLSMRMKGPFLYPSAEPWVETTKEKAAQANLYHPYKLIQDNFVFSPDTRGNDKAWFRQGQREDPATVRFLSLKDYASLRMSGMGQLGIFWIDMGERLGSFLDLRWWDYSDTPMHRFRADLYRDGEVLRACTERLKGRLSVSCIGSGIPDTDKNTILRILTGKEFGFTDSDIRTVFDPAACSIVIKHDAGYYAGKTDITRKFYRDHPRSALQGITSEGLRNFDYEKKTPVMKDDSTIATMLRACVIALAVKSDIQQGKMTLTSLARHGFTAPVSFAMAYRSEESGRKSPTHYFCMTVDPSDGSLTFSHFTHDELLRDRTEWQIKIASAFGMDGDLTEHNPLGTELAFWEDIDDIHVIRNTGENVIPNVELLVRDYEAMSGKKMTLNEFEKRFGRYRADMIAAGTFSAEELGGYWQKIMEKLKGETVLSYAQLQSAIYHRDSLKFYNRFKPYHPDFAVFPRTGDHLVKYGLLPLTGGWWFRTPSYNPENPGETRVDSVSYFLGSKDSLNYSQERGVVIKQIIRRNGKPVDDAFIRKILGMMYVDFVRIKQWTVLPFPAKYLREYIDIMKTQSPEGLRTAADAVQDEDGTD